MLSYLAAAPISVTAIDLNPAHVALNKLKLAALAHLPDYAAFRTFFADANRKQNIEAYFDYLCPHLDAATRKYWESRDRVGRRRIGYFGSNVYRHGLLGNFIGAGHLLARAHGKNPRLLLAARTRSRAAPHFRERARAAVPQASHPLAARQAVGTVRPRHPSLAVHCPQRRPSEHGGRAARPSRAPRLRLRLERQLLRLAGLRTPLCHERSRAAAALSAARELFASCASAPPT